MNNMSIYSKTEFQNTFDTQIIERHLESWQNIGFIPDLQWYGATADFLLTFTNIR